MTSEPIRIDSADISENVDEANSGLMRALERYADLDAERLLDDMLATHLREGHR